MYDMKFGAARRSRVLREDIAVDPMLAPMSDPMTDPLAGVDPAMSDIVTDVAAVDPTTRRFRATVTRTVTQTALVEFDAPETADLYVMAEALLPQIPVEAWVDSPADSWGFIDRIEPIDATPSEPPSPDMVAPDVALSDVLTAEELDPLAVPSALSRHRRRRSRRGVRLVGFRANPRKRRFARRRNVRMTADEVTLAVQDILSRGEQIIAVMPATSAEATAQFDGLIALEDELLALEATVFDGTAPAAEAIAYEMIANAIAVVSDMIMGAEELVNEFMIETENIGASDTDPLAALY